VDKSEEDKRPNIHEQEILPKFPSEKPVPQSEPPSCQNPIETSGESARKAPKGVPTLDDILTAYK
jgi:hypothetical protein